ncbi:putative acyl-coenzyme A oxidase 2 peroxisomal precursor [Dunaliella salina]|uniref:Acyl-coenzyme A oxidase n=3 Tax=Dunaliella salina TaxID=3046 RepID=A0ABQ7GQ45_DUNSA|nr:putative acyl-coenzyme A oxidase 2 peroxisomal precursor [Dunaliella salina]|eukprot:KAF5836725.1 putative acyl-coenzyme A oxidase 2 peroxisomal precursor [Dunaliella salina]
MAQTSRTSAKGAAKSLPFFDWHVMETYIDDQREMKQLMYDLFKSHPEMLTPVEEGLTKEEHRERVRQQLRLMLTVGINPMQMFSRDMKKYFYLAECMALIDLSLTVKAGVQFSLWGGRLKVPDPHGGRAMVDHGVHAFIVPLRDDAGQLLPGVEIHDCGYKVGLNGVDNGAIRFTHVRIPRVNLLDRFGSVDKSGRYSSPLTSQGRRFAATLGELTGGRVGLCSGSVGTLKGALCIAIRYCAQRQQFGPPDAQEVAVLDYQSTQQRLIPMLATCYGLHFAKQLLVDRYCEMKRTKDHKLVEEVHALSAGLKAYTTRFTQNALSVCREACGGHGYAAVNRLGALRSDHDIFQTFEGDNTVLLQQVSGLLLKEYRSQFQGAPLSSTFAFLRQLAASSLPNNPLVTHETDVRHLRDPSFLASALEYRTARMLFTLSLRLRKHTPRVGSFEAWNKCFQRAVEECTDPDCRRSLRALADTFALNCIMKDVIFRNDEYIAPGKAKAIQRLLVELCSELRGVAVPLVNAFAIPDHILRAPIGLAGSGVSDMYKEYLLAAGFDV